MKAQLKTDTQPDHDVIIIGAGVSGIYQLYRLLEMGVNVTVLEAGGGPGGTWYWNRYPGARFDSESYTYGYSFSKELLEEWNWSEHFSGQPETLRYLNHVIEKFDLRDHMQFDAQVKSAAFDEGACSWTLTLANGRTLSTRFLLTAIGMLSAPTMPTIPGVEYFKGEAFHTYYWPQEPMDFTGKKVGVIGTGATAVQLIGEIADKVGELTVFQRRPNWCAPLHNGPIDRAEMDEIRANYDEIFARCKVTPGGFIHGPDRRKFSDVNEDERLAFWEELYNSRGFGVWLGNFREIFTDEAANAEISDYIADRIRQRVKDPVVAEKLIPRDHGFGVQRVPLETNYLEAYNRDNVRLVDINEAPIERITPKGIQTSGAEYELDVIIFATGYDAGTGSLTRIDIRGEGGQTIKDKYAGGPRNYMGLQSVGFPNLFIMPGAGAGNFTRGCEPVVEWVADCIGYMRQNEFKHISATPEAEEAWTEYVAEAGANLLRTKADSWFVGANIPGKARVLLGSPDSAPVARAKRAQVAANGYEGFLIR